MVYKPLEQLIITQPFGSTAENYAQFGYKGHNGTDFKTRNLGTQQGFFANLMGWQNVYAACAGTVQVIYDLNNYGTHIYLTDDQGNQYLYAHLKNARCITGQRVKGGDLIALSGSTGNVTGPHLHWGYKPKNSDPNNGYGGFVDPMPLFNPPYPKVPLKVARIGLSLPAVADFQTQVAKYSSNKISCVVSDYSANPVGTFTQDQAYALVDQINPKEEFIFIFYQGAPDSVFYSTYYDPQRDCLITTAPGTDPRLLAFEFSHQLGTYTKVHGHPEIEVLDSNYPSDAFIKAKYDLVSQYFQ